MRTTDLRTVGLALETAAGASTTANNTDIGWWMRIAAAAEDLANAGTTANANELGFMRRTAIALEVVAGGSGAQENDTYFGYLERIADALEIKASATYPGSIENRVLQGAINAVWSLYNTYALAFVPTTPE